MRKFGVVIGLVAIVIAAGAAYVWFSGGSGEPSTEVTAPPVTTLAATQAEAGPEEAEPDPEPRSDEEMSPSSAGEEPGAATVSTTATTEAEDPGTSMSVVYRIDKDSSSVRFELDEMLQGNPKRVVGVTTEVAGELLLDFGDPSASRLGVIRINVRTLETDSGFRDRAMRGPILGSARDDNEFATFDPTGIEGLPDQVAVGDRVSLVVTGDFTLSGVTRSVVFETVATVVEAARNRGIRACCCRCWGHVTRIPRAA